MNDSWDEKHYKMDYKPNKGWTHLPEIKMIINKEYHIMINASTIKLQSPAICKCKVFKSFSSYLLHPFHRQHVTSTFPFHTTFVKTYSTSFILKHNNYFILFLFYFALLHWAIIHSNFYFFTHINKI